MRPPHDAPDEFKDMGYCAMAGLILAIPFLYVGTVLLEWADYLHRKLFR